VEKPRLEAAGRLVAEGALVNSFIFAVTSGALLRLYRQTAYDVLFSFLTHKRRVNGPGAASLASLYRSIEPRDFSRDILERAIGDLAVVRVHECGWEDLGTPERLERHLARQSHFRRAPRPMLHPGL
jgi:mannose-1-phosphate guanylyltransferase